MRKAILTAVASCLIAAPMVLAAGGQNSGPNANQDATPRREHRMGNNVQARVEHRVARLTKVLSLNSSQQQQATTIFTNAANANRPVFAELRTAGRSLATAVKSNEPASTIKQFSTTIGNDTGELVANEAAAYEQFYQILSPDQQTKLSQMHRMGFRGGFGGRGVM